MASRMVCGEILRLSNQIDLALTLNKLLSLLNLIRIPLQNECHESIYLLAVVSIKRDYAWPHV